MATRAVRVLVVDDSLFMREYIASALSTDPGIEIAGKAADPYEARDKIIELKPDVMTLDINMPKMNGIDFLKKLMPQYPLPVVVISAVGSNVFDALDAGAVDFITKPELKTERDKQQFISEMTVKIKIASIAKVGQHKHSPARSTSFENQGPEAKNCIIAIGASTGGTEATLSILQELGNDLPGIVVVQHMPPVFTRLYAERLNNICAMEVREAKNNDEVKPGTVLIAPGGLHMGVVRRGGGFAVECKEGEKISGHCPSVDYLFDSVAKLKGINRLGIIMTGMGSDGAKGLLAMRQSGAFTIGQDQKTCVVYGMPAVANRIGAVEKELPLDAIARELYEWSRACCSGRKNFR
jgi:two-component system chemotaxis response regulator CheB